ncbi:SCO6745 family protein [Streptomyces sp. CA-132043]|uniref:SCO6745 family protein n=1 Tax=Streptomyces sp. CA-132043 TaxID=3240048 RepID=UPI003D915C4E
MSEYPAVARRLWHQLEPLHATLYYSPEAFEEAAALGYDVGTRWPSYFAWRTAPLGAAGPELVAATYYSFSPRMVEQYVPLIWSTAAPAKVLEARLRAMDRVLRRLMGDRLTKDQITEAARLARQAAENAIPAARPLAAANLDLPWPAEPHLELWQALTVLREHRGDGHLAALLTAGLDPCESLVSFAAVGAAPEDHFRSRGWTSAEWRQARDRLAARGWIAPDGRATDRAREGREEIERLTDRLAAGPWRALGRARADRLAQLVNPLLAAVFESGHLPKATTLGIGRIRVAY